MKRTYETYRPFYKLLMLTVIFLMFTACVTFPIASYQTPDVLTPGKKSAGMGLGLNWGVFNPETAGRQGFKIPLEAEEQAEEGLLHIMLELPAPEFFFRYGLSDRMDIGVRFFYSPISYDGVLMMHADLKRQILAEPFKLAIDLGMSWTRFGSRVPADGSGFKITGGEPLGRIPARGTVRGGGITTSLPLLNIESANGSTVAKTDITDRDTPMTLTGIYPMILVGYGRFYGSAKWLFLGTSDGWRRNWPGLSIGYRIGSRFQLLPEVNVVFAESIDQYGNDLNPLVWYSLGILLNARK